MTWINHLHKYFFLFILTHRNLHCICLSLYFSCYTNTVNVIFVHGFVLESGRLYVQLITTGFLTL